jgi:RimJ/RimL family protein N-acetyltransferase
VRLEPLELAHVDALLAAATEDRVSYDFTLVPDTAAAMFAYVSGALDDERTGWALPFVIRRRADDRLVGSTRFLDLDYWDGPASWPPGRPSSGGQGAPSTGEIGSTWLAASAQRTTVNTECKLLLLGHAFDGWKMHRVTFKTDARNQRSRRAIERIGGQFEGIRRAHTSATDGTVRDSAYYSIIRDEWPTVRTALAARLAGRPAR